ncbi:hypothetical protein [Frigoribacterium sp. UYMn621]|jgi:hypothetical protein|uniref:hypothetical protein n=1 Tax=Frigoribacterium sp. UYMn621 TaxID=3156343 RepID=UPI0033951736
MKWKIIIAATIVAVAVVIGISVLGHGTNPPASAPGGSASPSVGGAATVLPVSTNPIVNASTAPGLSIVSAMAENNVDPATKKPIADRLQVTVKNSSANTLSGFEIYYTMTDATTKQSESYYVPLTGLTVAAGASATVFFDNQAGPNHYAENKFSLYRSSTNQVDFAVEVSAKGVAVAKGTAVKGKGTGEVVGG